MSTSTDLIQTRATPQQLAKIEEVAAECGRQLVKPERPFAASFAVAAAIRKLEELITDEMMQDVMSLQGHPLGFRTDKDIDKFKQKGEGYPVAIVKIAFIEATARGFFPRNNEWNIIGGNFYGAKSGFYRLVHTFPGLINFQESVGVPERAGNRAFVAYVASWEIEGKVEYYQRSKKRLRDKTEFDDRFVVRVNEGSTDDAIIGKVHRKAYRDIYDRLIGADTPTPEGDVADPIDVESTSVEGRKVQRSTLFADEPLDDGPPADQEPLIEEYRNKLAQCEKKTDAGPIAKQAGGDQRLSEESRKTVMAMCAERRKEL